MIEQHPYIGPDRRLSDRRNDDVAEHIRAFVKKEFEAHEAREKTNTVALIEAFKAEAFVDTPAQHKSAHQSLIDASKAEEAFWRDLRSDIAKKSIWGVLQILLTLIAIGAAAKLGLSSVFGK